MKRKSARGAARWLVLMLVVVLPRPARADETRVIDAVRQRDGAALRAALQKGASANSADADGTAALHWAVELDDVEMTDLLIRAGADVNAVNRYGVPPLTLACINGSTAIVERLLEAGV